MKHAYTQSELQSFLNAGKNIIIGYRSAATLKHSPGASEVILVPLPRKLSGQPYTPQGRRFAVTPQDFQSLQTA